MLRWRFPLLLLAGVPLAGCNSLLSETTADTAGIAGAAAAGAITNNATVGAGIGLGVRSAADAGLKFAQRRAHGAEQDQIAAAAGDLQSGQVGTWRVSHDLPIERDEHGLVTVARAFGGPDFTCRDIVFSVDGGTAKAPTRAFYTATVCLDGKQWKWATAEPATAQWGPMQ
jgi:hypothetical protein